MLYNKEWEKKPGYEFNIDNLISWIKTQDPQKTYNFTNPRECLLAQWVMSVDPYARYVVKEENSFTYSVFGQEICLAEYISVVTDPRGRSEHNFENALQRAIGLQHIIESKRISGPKPSLLGRLLAACSLSGNKS